jgi:PBP1b-binding outer membrane lipoprotein LpoB
MHTQLLLAIAASTLLFTGCASKEEPAKQVVAGAEATLAPVRSDAAIYAPEQLQAAEANLAAAKDNITWEKYDDVIQQAPALNASVVAVKEAVVSKQTQLAAATHEWEELNAEVPKMVEALEKQVSNLPKAKREATKTEVEAMKATWAEATAAFTAGDPTQAADKGRQVLAKGKELFQQLGMSPV